MDLIDGRLGVDVDDAAAALRLRRDVARVLEALGFIRDREPHERIGGAVADGPGARAHGKHPRRVALPRPLLLRESGAIRVEHAEPADVGLARVAARQRRNGDGLLPLALDLDVDVVPGAKHERGQRVAPDHGAAVDHRNGRQSLHGCEPDLEPAHDGGHRRFGVSAVRLRDHVARAGKSLSQAKRLVEVLGRERGQHAARLHRRLRRVARGNGGVLVRHLGLLYEPSPRFPARNG